jgi:hypothetical protein
MLMVDDLTMLLIRHWSITVGLFLALLLRLMMLVAIGT